MAELVRPYAKYAAWRARPPQGKIIAGVCAGIARRFGWSPTTVRLVFLLSCLLPGPQVLAYIVLWVVVPKED